MTDQAETTAQKIPAIMFTDIAGFSKKLADNEVRAFELLKTHDALIRVLAAKFDGKVLKSLGDSFLVEFPNIISSVKCAIEIQKRFWNFNRGKVESDTIRVRIGIHLSEVAARHNDITGEDITIASRIEALTEPNRICITLDAYNKVKNLIQLHVFEIGPIELKDISRKIVVYEVLIDTIPELAQPSNTAVQASMIQQDTIAAKREVEELHEARRIEETKQRILSDQARAEDERNKNISIHYARAEAYFEVGEIAKAEQELAEIAKLDPQLRPPSDRERQEKENERVVQNHLTKAREYFNIGNIDEAEEEVNEIFRLLPLHTGAQQLLMQIEEERYRREEKKRAKQTESVVKQASQEEKKIEELLSQAQALLHSEKFTEATFVLRDLFLIDPNHSGARRLEESIRQAKQAKAEIVRIEEEQHPEEPPIQEIAKKLQEKIKERKSRPVHILKSVEHTSPASISLPSRKIMYIATVVVGIIILFLGIKLIDWIFPKNTSIAILRFTANSSALEDVQMLDAIPVLLARDFTQSEHLVVIAPSSSLLYMPDPAFLQKIASALRVEYLLLGTIQEEYGQYVISLTLVNPEQEKSYELGTVRGTIDELSKIRFEIRELVFDKIGIKSGMPEIPQPSNSNALDKYLKGLHLMQLKSGTEIDSAKSLFRAAVKIDPTFGPAYASLADIELRMYRTMDVQNFLKSAAENAQLALKYSHNSAVAYRVLGSYYRSIQNYDSALSFINKSLTIVPEDPECFRELTLLSLAGRKFDEAIGYASSSVLYDPRNVESHFTLGLAQHMKQSFVEAENSYQQAQIAGESNSLLMAYYMQNVWISQGSFDRVVRYCQQMLQTSPENYRYYYWIGRAYQLSLQITTAQQWLEKGLTTARQAIDDDPNDPVAYAYAGLIHSRLGQFSDGEAALNKAVQLDSNSVEILFRFADLYSVQRNKEKAMAALSRAINRQYNYAELLNPDLSFISSDPEYLNLITKKIDGKWPLR